MHPNLVTARAALEVAEMLFTALREIDPEGLKRRLDERRDQLEGALAKTAGRPGDPQRAVAVAELDLLSRLFASLA